jgi:ABC-type nickel/cobalt efflux system permease component RcnA
MIFPKLTGVHLFSVIFLGFLIGMQHAMEADHVAAVASLATRSRSPGQTARQGAAWGAGHALTLFVFGGLVLVMDTLVPERFAQGLELAVGFMLVFLGLDVLRRLLRERVHFHQHRHGATVHFHAHSHTQRQAHADDPHQHEHLKAFPLRALLVGMMHGMAGSAALIILTLNSVLSVTQGILYIALFGVGSIVGMALLAAVISLPLRYSSRSFTWAHNGLKAAVGLVTIGVGSKLIYELGIIQGLLINA